MSAFDPSTARPLDFGQDDQKQPPRAFDPSTAQPLNSESVFDPSTAQPYEPPNPFMETVKRTGGHMVASAGQALEDTLAPDTGKAIRQYGEEIMREHPTQIPTLGAMARHPLTTVQEALGNIAPQIATTMAAGATGARIGGLLGAPFGPQVALAGAGLGGILGGLGVNVGQEYGEIRANQREAKTDDKGKALTGALAAGALEYIPERMFGKGIVDAATGKALIPHGMSRLGYAGRQAAKGALAEGVLTEVPQTYIENYFGDQPITAKTHEEAAMAGILGGVGGGFVGGLTGAATRRESAPAEKGGVANSDSPQNKSWDRPHPRVPLTAAPEDAHQEIDLNTGRHVDESGRNVGRPAAPGAGTGSATGKDDVTDFRVTPGARTGADGAGVGPVTPAASPSPTAAGGLGLDPLTHPQYVDPATGEILTPAHLKSPKDLQRAQIDAARQAYAQRLVDEGRQPGELPSITAGGQKVLDWMAAGGVPAFITHGLRVIAAANGIAIDGRTTPNDIIDALRARPGAVVPGADTTTTDGGGIGPAGTTPNEDGSNAAGFDPTTAQPVAEGQGLGLADLGAQGAIDESTTPGASQPLPPVGVRPQETAEDVPQPTLGLQAQTAFPSGTESAAGVAAGGDTQQAPSPDINQTLIDILSGGPADARQITQTGAADGGRGAQPGIRQEGGRAAEGGQGIQPGGPAGANLPPAAGPEAVVPPNVDPETGEILPGPAGGFGLQPPVVGPEFGADNKIVTKDVADAARERLRKKFAAMQAQAAQNEGPSENRPFETAATPRNETNLDETITPPPVALEGFPGGLTPISAGVPVEQGQNEAPQAAEGQENQEEARAPQDVAIFRDREAGTESHVVPWNGPGGGFIVSYRDTEGGEFLDEHPIFKTRTEAFAKARQQTRNAPDTEPEWADRETALRKPEDDVARMESGATAAPQIKPVPQPGASGREINGQKSLLRFKGRFTRVEVLDQNEQSARVRLLQDLDLSRKAGTEIRVPRSKLEGDVGTDLEVDASRAKALANLAHHRNYPQSKLTADEKRSFARDIARWEQELADLPPGRFTEEGHAQARGRVPSDELVKIWTEGAHDDIDFAVSRGRTEERAYEDFSTTWNGKPPLSREYFSRLWDERAARKAPPSGMESPQVSTPEPTEKGAEPRLGNATVRFGGTTPKEGVRAQIIDETPISVRVRLMEDVDGKRKAGAEVRVSKSMVQRDEEGPSPVPQTAAAQESEPLDSDTVDEATGTAHLLAGGKIITRWDAGGQWPQFEEQWIEQVDRGKAGKTWVVKTRDQSWRGVVTKGPGGPGETWSAEDAAQKIVRSVEWAQPAEKTEAPENFFAADQAQTAPPAEQRPMQIGDLVRARKNVGFSQTTEGTPGRVTHIDKKGYIRVEGMGGAHWKPSDFELVGQDSAQSEMDKVRAAWREEGRKAAQEGRPRLVSASGEYVHPANEAEWMRGYDEAVGSLKENGQPQVSAPPADEKGAETAKPGNATVFLGDAGDEASAVRVQVIGQDPYGAIQVRLMEDARDGLHKKNWVIHAARSHLRPDQLLKTLLRQAAAEQAEKDAAKVPIIERGRARKAAKADRVVDPKTDSLLAAIAKRGGVSLDEARRQGIDPADLKVRGHKIYRVFTAKGMTFDDMAHNVLQPDGYPVTGANDLLDAIQKELRGQRQYTPQGAETAAQTMYPDEERQADAEAAEQAEHEAFVDPGFMLEPEEYSEAMDATGRRMAELAAYVDTLEDGAGERIVDQGIRQDLSNDEIIRQLEEFASAHRARMDAREQGQGAQAEIPGQARPEPTQATTDRTGQVDGFGRDENAQALADRQREIEQRMQGTEDVPAGMGAGDIFSGAIDQTDFLAGKSSTETSGADVPGALPRDFGANNKIVTKDVADAARERLRKKLGTLQAGIDPELLQDGILLAAYYIEGGVREFGAWSQRMLEDLGDAARPYLRSWYEGSRWFPGIDNTNMSTPEQIQAHLERMEQSATPAQDRAAGRGIVNDLVAHLRYGKGFNTIVDARKWIGERTGVRIEPGTPEAKQAEELIELAGVMAARAIVAQQRDPAAMFDALADLAERLPNLGTRSSTSVEQQAYSTPLPVAYVASQRAGMAQGGKAGEPTAGNGALLIEVDPRNAVVNELNPDRAEALRAQGFTVTEHNAVKQPLASPKSLDRIIMNPPFGVVKDQYGESLSYQITPEYTTTEIDHAIALKALDALKDDGKAVLIVGAPNKKLSDAGRSDAYNGKAKRSFYYSLYNAYKVTDHFTVAGELYAKQGAAWPVDVIVIEGRGKSALPLPAARVPRIINSVEGLKNELQRGAQSEMGARPPAGAVRGPTGETAGGGVSVPGADGPGGSGAVPGVSGESAGGTRPLGDAEGRPGGGSLGVGPDDRAGSGGGGNLGDVGAGPAGTVRNGRGRDTGAAAGQSAAVENAYQTPYQPASTAWSVGTQVPTNMRTSVQAALANVEQRRGPVDRYVADQLGYTLEDVLGTPGKPGYFSAEQIDALALALDNFGRGKGFIIGDQTGVGKGRVVAATIRWAMRNGKTPIFVTATPELYGDMLRDLKDIGMPNVKPFPTNSGFAIPLDEEAFAWQLAAQEAKAEQRTPPPRYGKFMKTPGGSTHTAAIAKMIGEGDLGEYDAIFTTYDQMQTVKGENTRRNELLEQFSSGAVLILDESHKAGGVEVQARNKKEREALGGEKGKMGRAGFTRKLVKNASSVLYSSATYAKRPDVMDLYSATDMGQLGEELANAMQAGGVPLQQVVASMLTEAGQYVRREKSFEGINYDTVSAPVDRQFAENAATVIREIMKFDRMVKAAVEDMDQDIKAAAQTVTGDRSTGGAGASSTSFTAVMHNLIAQMLLTLKVQPSIDQALAALRRDEKVVIALANTMGSAIEEYVKDTGLNPGDAIALNFGDLMKRYLEKSRRVQIGQPFGPKEMRPLTDDELGPQAVRFYNNLMKQIDGMRFGDVPISPIDAITHALEREGYKVGEITGRGAVIDYSGELPVYRRRQTSSALKAQTINRFNNGQIDVIVLNQSGATGLSLHASEKFRDQRKRVMILTQAELNIDTHMQMLGRINRTGQVVLPAYQQLVADIPAEKRPASVLSRKMGMLNANTTAAKDSAVTSKEVPDFMNQYGDQVAAQLMEENPQMHLRLGLPLKPEEKGEGLQVEGAMRKVTGRIPAMPLKEQEQLYDQLEAAYNDLIDILNRTGQNMLEAKTLDLQAETKEKTEVTAPMGGEGPFAAGVYSELVNAKRLGNAYTVDQIKELIQREVKGETPAETWRAISRYVAALEAKLKDDFDAYCERIVDRIEDDKKRQAQQTRLDGMYHKAARALGTLAPGKLVKLTLEDGYEYIAYVGAIEEKPNAAENPAAGSRWRFKFYPADPIKQFTVSLSQLVFEKPEGGIPANKGLVSLDVDSQQAQKEFEQQSHGSKELRTILTGNLLAGFGKFRSGQLINFTRADGSIAQGILMPRYFDTEQAMQAEPVEFQAADQAAQYLREATDHVTLSDGQAQALNLYRPPRSDGFVLSVPASKADGGRYYLNQALRQAAGKDFHKYGQSMRVDFGPERIDEVVRQLYTMGVKLQTDVDKDRARAIVKNEAGREASSENARLENENGRDNRVEARKRRYDPYTQDLFGTPLPAPNVDNLLGDEEERPKKPGKVGDGSNDAAAGQAVGGDVQPAPAVQLASKVVHTQTGQITTGFPQVTTWPQAAHTVAQLRKFPQEHFLTVVLDKDRKVIAALRHTIGKRDASQVSPSLVVGSVYAIPGAKEVIFAHNHPSGRSALSESDNFMGDKLADLMRETGIEPWGIMAVGDRKFSYRDTRPDGVRITPEMPIPAARRQTTIPVMERIYRKRGRLSDEAITSPRVAMELARDLLPDKTGLLLLDAQHYPIGLIPLAAEDLKALRGEGGQAGRIFKALHESNAGAAMMIWDGNPAERDVRNVGTLIASSDVRMLDVINMRSFTSWVEKGLDLAEPTPYYSRGKEGGTAGASYEIQGDLLDASGRPYVGGPDLPPSGRDGVRGYSITRDEYEQLKKSGELGLFRVATKGPDTTGFQGWFLDEYYANPYNQRTVAYPKKGEEMREVRGSKETADLTGRIARQRDLLRFGGSIETLGGRPKLRIQLLEKGAAQPENLYSRQAQFRAGTADRADRLRSRQADTHTVESLTARIRTALQPLGDLADPLLASGWFQVITDDQVGHPNNRGAAGIYLPQTGHVNLVADNIPKSWSDQEIRGLVLHEIGVHARHLGQNDKAWKEILRQFEAMEHAGNKEVGAAFRRAMRAGVRQEILNEEALAYFIEANPDLPFSRRVLAWFRMMLRKIGEKLTGLNKTRWMRWANSLTRDDLVTMAQGALAESMRNPNLSAKLTSSVTQGAPVTQDQKAPALASQSAMKSAEANIARGQKALAKAVTEKTSVHRAMFRTGLGWVDFVWGDIGRVMPSGKTRHAMGLSHILEARQRTDGMSRDGVSRLLDRIVEAIAKGSEIRRYTYQNAINATLAHQGVEVVLVKNSGSNAWVLSGWTIRSGAPGTGDVAPGATQQNATTTRVPLGADDESIELGDSDIKFSRGLSDDPEGVFAEIDQITASQGPWQEQAGKLRDRWESLKGGFKRHWLGALSVRQVAEIGKEILPGITEYTEHMQGMAATRTQIFDMADKIAKEWGVLVPGDAERNRIEQNRLAAVMHEATIAGVDPAEEYTPSIDLQDAAKKIRVLQAQMRQRSGENQAERMKEVEALKQRMAFEHRRLAQYEPIVRRFNRLTPKAQEVYRKARDYHVAQSKRVENALIAMIGESMLSGKAKAEAIAKLRKEFESNRVQAPYFPLSRSGDYWVFLKPEDGGDHEFHMFQTVEQLERFIEQQKIAGAKILGRGKQTENLGEVVGVSVGFVEDVENLLKQMGGDPMVDAVRDQVYQLFLATLPDLSVRKHFIHRKKTLGFGQDALKAFAEKSYHDAYQYARLKHGMALRQTMEDLKADLEAANRPAKRAETKKELDEMMEFRDSVMGQMTAQQVDDVVELLTGRAVERPELKDELKKWQKYQDWMEQWTKRGGLPTFISRRIKVLGRRLETGKRINAKERGYEFAANVYDELQAAYRQLMNPQTSPVANMVNQLGFVWFLGFSPSAWLVNAMQTPMVSVPYAGAKFGMDKAAKAFTRAYQRAFTKDEDHLFSIRGALTGEALKAYDEAVAMGLIDRTRAHDLAGLAEEGTQRSGLNRKLMEISAAGFHHAERLNREVTFVAGFELAKESGMGYNKAVAYAQELVWKTHLDYAAENRPRFLRGNVARVIGQFKLYSQGITYLLGKSFADALNREGVSAETRKEARRFLALQFGMQFAAAGALGLPVGAAMMVAKALLDGDDDDPEDFEGLFRQAMADWTGSKTAGTAVSTGLVNALTPIDLSSRLSLADLWLREPNRQLEGRDAAYWVMTSILGPMAGIIESALVGAKLINDGQTYRGIEKMLPNALNDAAKGLRYATEGAKTLKGDKLLEEVTPAESLFQVLGFTPARLETRYAENAARKNVEQRIEDRRSQLLRMAAESRVERDREAMLETNAMIQAFNEKNPTRRIGGDDIAMSIRTRARYRAQASGGMFLNPRLRTGLEERFRFAQ